MLGPDRAAVESASALLCQNESPELLNRLNTQNEHLTRAFRFRAFASTRCQSRPLPLGRSLRLGRRPAPEVHGC